MGAGKFVNVKNKEIWYEIKNEHYFNQNNSILVFLHEGLGTSTQWKSFPDILSEKLKMPALLFDRYGYGKSQKINEERSIGYLEAEAKDFLPKLFSKIGLDDTKKILIGHSDGATIALIYAALYPKFVTAVISEAAHVFMDEVTINGVTETAGIEKSKRLIAHLKRYHGENTEKMFYSWINVWNSEEMKSWNVEKYLPKILCPVLAIQGENDNYGDYSQLQSISENIKANTEILLIPECGHMPHHQAQDTVINNCVNFINNQTDEIS